MPTTEPPPPSAESELLQQALTRRRWKAPQLAREVSMSTDWVRVLLRGYRNVGKGAYEAVVPDAVALATLAQALGNITEDELVTAGRPDAAKVLEALGRAPSGPAVVDRLKRVRDDIDTLIRELRSQ